MAEARRYEPVMAEARRYDSDERRPYQDKNVADWTLYDEWDWLQDYLDYNVIVPLNIHDQQLLKYLQFDWIEDSWFWRTRDDLPPLPEWIIQSLDNDSRIDNEDLPLALLMDNELIDNGDMDVLSHVPGAPAPPSQAEIDQRHAEHMEYIAALPIEPVDPAPRYDSQVPPEYVTPPPVYKTPEFSPNNQPCRLNMCVNDAMPGSEFCSSCHGAKGRKPRRSRRKPRRSRRKPRHSRKKPRHSRKKPRHSRKKPHHSRKNPRHSRRKNKGKIHKKTRSKN